MYLTKRDIAYHKIKEMILQGVLSTDSMLSEKNLASELGMSRTPVREALQRLVHEGFMKEYSRKGAVVNDVTMAEAMEIIDFRMAVEEFMVLNLQNRWDDEKSAQLEQMLQEQEKLVDAGNSMGFLESDVKFHDLIAQFYGNQLIRDTLKSVRERFLVAGGVILRDQPSVRRAYEGHVQIVKALRQKNFAAAQEEMHAHLVFAKKNFLN